jgi:hypothetical protein
MDVNDRDLRDIAALADGSLPEHRRAEVEARVEASPELRELLAKQRAALAALRAAAGPAPEALREWVAAVARERRRPRERLAALLPARGPLRPALSAAAALALVAAVVVALALPGGAPEGPDVAEAADLATRPPSEPAPGRYDGEPELLDRTSDGLRFPRWEPQFGWRATGARADRLDGRSAVTVYYRRARRTLGYTIVAAPALRVPAHAKRAEAGGTDFRSFERAGRTVVTWRRAGRTCVLSARGVGSDTMLALAGWRAEGRLRY